MACCSALAPARSDCGSCSKDFRSRSLAAVLPRAASARLPPARALAHGFAVPPLRAARAPAAAKPTVAQAAPVLLPTVPELALAAELRGAGIGVELYPEPRKLGAQLKYADRRGFAIAVIAGSHEFDSGSCQVKDLRAKHGVEVPRNELIGRVRDVL